MQPSKCNLSFTELKGIFRLIPRMKFCCCIILFKDSCLFPLSINCLQRWLILLWGNRCSHCCCFLFILHKLSYLNDIKIPMGCHSRIYTHAIMVNCPQSTWAEKFGRVYATLTLHYVSGGIKNGQRSFKKSSSCLCYFGSPRTEAGV